LTAAKNSSIAQIALPVPVAKSTIVPNVIMRLLSLL